jgi:hypothetical protein
VLQVPAPEDLPSPGFGGGGEYAALMHECWAQDPADRPTFAAVISRLRRMLAVEAGLRRDSPTKVPRGLAPLSTRAPSGSLGGGGGGEDTPVSRSRQASLHGGSDLCLSPDPVLSASPSDTDTLVLSASTSVVSGAGAGGSPPRPARPSSGSGSTAQQPPPRHLSSAPGGGADESGEAHVAAAAGSTPPGDDPGLPG